MLKELELDTLKARRREHRLLLFYKTVNGLASIPMEDSLLPTTES